MIVVLTDSMSYTFIHSFIHFRVIYNRHPMGHEI